MKYTSRLYIPLLFFAMIMQQSPGLAQKTRMDEMWKGTVAQPPTGKRLSDYINPFIGASTSIARGGNGAGLGKTFPGAATPFGLVQVSPNTITGGDNGSGYSYEHTTIEGFACTQMSGVGWYGDLGNFLVMPTTGKLSTVAGKDEQDQEGYRSKYDKSSEKASAGYYAVRLTKYDVLTELTAAPHSAMMRFTFPANDQSRLQIDLARRVGGRSTAQFVEVVDDHTIRGWMKCPPEGGGWGHGGGHADYTVYFYAQCSQPIKQFGVWSKDSILPMVRKKEGSHLGFYTEFATKTGQQVLLKTGISFVSMEGAEKNLKTEIPGWNFDHIHETTRRLWDIELEKIRVKGGTEDEKTTFYTAVYHTLIDPRSLSDVDGTYPGGDGKAHKTKLFTKHSIFSGWDVFRSQMPLQTILHPRVVNDLIASLVELADQSGNGYLERWEFLNAYSGCMVGNPAVVVLADAYVKGIRDYNVNKAYQFAVNTCERFGNQHGWEPGNISVTLENGFSEWCLSRLAAALGKEDDRKKYSSRGESYRNIWDDSVHWFRPRKKDGSWMPWPKEGRMKEGYGTVESNPYQQGWFVPQDIQGMVQLMGGRETVIRDLQQFFERAPDNLLWNEYYNHANEPVHHVPFLFNRLGAPWLTQRWTREICRRAYHNSVEGLVGNEDVGQMSAWYVLAASGLHPVCPGDTRWEITSPLFERVVMTLDPHYAKGKTFTIVARNNSPENIYIRSATLNGKPYTNCWIDHSVIMAGGVLELEMGSQPGKEWGVEASAQASVNFATAYSSIRINGAGYITEIRNRNGRTSRNFCDKEKQSPLLSLYNSTTKEYFYPQTFSYSAKNKQAILTYSNGSVAIVTLEPKGKYLKLTLTEIRNRSGIDGIEWGTLHTNINNLFGEMIGVARDTSRGVNFSIGLLALNDITTGGRANELSADGYIVHTPDAKRFPLPDSLHEGDLFTLGGDGHSDVAFFSKPEEYFRILSGNTAFIDTKGNIAIAYYARDRRSEKWIYYPTPANLKAEDDQQKRFMQANYPIHQLTQALPGIDYIGSSVALWAAPDTEGLNVIENIVLNERLPHPTVNGKWVKDPSAFIPDISWHGNYDSCISYTRQLGFKAVQGEGLGEFYPNQANKGHINWKLPFKDGKREIKTFTDEAYGHDILFGLHTLNNFLQKNISSDVHPVPSDSLCIVIKRKLVKPVSAEDTLLYVDDPQYMDEYGGWEGHAENVLKIGKELIHYKGVSATAPYYLTGVKRGYWNTNATGHIEGDVIAKLMTNCYGGLAPDMFLQDKLAGYYAQLSEVNNMRYIDLDGEEGFLYQGHGNYAYKRFFRKFFDECKELGIPYMRVMGAGVTEGAWHYQSVWNVGGGRNMYFIKTRKWAIEGKDIRNVAFANYFPSTFGITETLHPSSTVQEWENLQALSVGVGVTYMMNLSEKSVEACKNKYEIFAAIKTWENARAANVFTAAVKAQLANTDRQFHLEQVNTHSWKLYEVENGSFVRPVLLTAYKRK